MLKSSLRAYAHVNKTTQNGSDLERISKIHPHVRTPIQHGGDAEAVRNRLGLGDLPLMDFSTSFNPLGAPPGVIAAAQRALDNANRYPVPFTPRLTERLAELHDVPVDRIVVGAGTTEIISLIGQSLREVLGLHAHELGDPDMPMAHLIEPTYAEYRRASVLNRLHTHIWSKNILGWEQDFLPRSAAGIFWTGHPNNPTGRAWDRERLLSLVDDTLGLLTVVDEAYLSFLPDEKERTVTNAVATRDNLLVLRSVTKIFSIPGLRIGYAVASPDMVIRLRQYQNPWSVSASAEEALLAAVDDDEYLERTADMIFAESNRVIERLWDMPGIRPVWPGRERPDDAPALPNFLLVSLVDTPCNSVQVHEELARRGFLVRECSNFSGLEPGSVVTGHDQIIATQGHLRFGLRTPAENDALLEALDEVLNEAGVEA
jgi:threonine-phosphate decarboxylase